MNHDCMAYVYCYKIYYDTNLNTEFMIQVPVFQIVKGLSQIVPRPRTASKNYYLSHMILLTVRAPGLICESPFKD